MRRQTQYLALIGLLAVCACAKNVQPRVTGPTPTKQQTFFAHYKQSLDLANFNYTVVFKMIGDAQRSGIINSADVKDLNAIGRIIQTSGQEATDVLALYLKLTDPGISEESKVQKAIAAVEKAVADIIALSITKGLKP